MWTEFSGTLVYLVHGLHKSIIWGIHDHYDHLHSSNGDSVHRGEMEPHDWYAQAGSDLKTDQKDHTRHGIYGLLSSMDESPAVR